MKKLLGALRQLVIVLLVLVLAVNLYFIGARLLGQEHATLFGFSGAVVISGSMEPAFYPGDFLIYRQQDSYAQQDIVIFHSGGAMVTHRIVGQTEDGRFITRGDNNNTNDEPISPAAIRGKMVLIIPALGDFLLFLRSPLGFFCLITLGALFLELPDLINFIRERKGKQDAQK